ncbi:F-box domain-containing protein [Purpureocillium lilacinum]|uniref:F-box domain-containing protein n=1 Tax=Purpureocillium lilacinum TaxID=33203 RepID=A0A179H141_PURLI|nr:F-box domain-containing protein [Purpureocillium lilacinum]OAQ83243.1 F-box domain-containing protein [Purpureocillium lilacinum]
MAPDDRPSRWDELPDEILLQILNYLEPYHITRLQLVSRKLQKLCLDDELWKELCFQDSPWYQWLRHRRNLVQATTEADDDVLMSPPDPASDVRDARRWRKLQDMANWDPAYPGERVSWYDEYIQRNGPACINWLQSPRMREGGCEAIIEARGMAMYNPYDGRDGLGTMLAVSPLDDGSVCLWDVKGTRGKQGSIVARSKPDILFFDGPNGQNTRRSKKIDTGVTECVSINNDGHRAFFAVQSHLIEVDLNRLEVVSKDSFEWSITSLSATQPGVPMTVGTSLGIHLHDFRSRIRPSHDVVERVDAQQYAQNDVLRALFDPKPLPPYASLSQPTPVSILHLPRPGEQDLVSDDIYVSGRFTNILHYDRRKFPAIVGSIYSGALIKSLTSMPFPYSTVDSEVRRRAEFSPERMAQIKTASGGQTLVAGGSYKTKGSLEIYGLSSAADAGSHTTVQSSVFKNRQSAASATILSVIEHGTKLVFSDGAGLIKWFERDGSTECRRLKIGHSDADEPASIFASMPASDDLARKILSTRRKDGQDRPNNDNILFWTGEKLGMVSFTTAPLYQAKDFESQGPERKADEEIKDQYAGRMRRALERQADEVRYMRNLGMGTGVG